MILAASTQWFAVHTHPNAEEKALAHLRRQEFDAYLPRYGKTRRHARRTDRVARPLFPRYLFVALDLEAQRWRPIRSTVGVADIVCLGERPMPVAAGVVEGLRRREDENGLIHLQPQLRLRVGEAVRVLDGAFAQCLGLFEGITDTERVAILLDLLGRKVRVVLDAEAIEAAA